MAKLYMFQEIFGEVDKFGWWDMEIIQTDAGTQFTSKDFQEGFHVGGVWLALVEQEYQELNGQVEMTRQTLGTIAH